MKQSGCPRSREFQDPGDSRFAIPSKHFDRKLGRAELGDCELPTWAASHSGYSSVEYMCRKATIEIGSLHFWGFFAQN